jgi:hypothetical protein
MIARSTSVTTAPMVQRFIKVFFVGTAEGSKLGGGTNCRGLLLLGAPTSNGLIISPAPGGIAATIFSMD